MFVLRRRAVKVVIATHGAETRRLSQHRGSRAGDCTGVP